MHLSQLVNVSLTLPTVFMTPPGVDDPVAAAAEVPVPVGNLIPVGIAEDRPARSVGTAVGTDTPAGTSVGKPAGTSVGTAGVCLGNKETLMLGAPPVLLCSAERWVEIGRCGQTRVAWAVSIVKQEMQRESQKNAEELKARRADA
jgi:hypothetical protein